MSAYPDDDSAGFDPVQTINDYADYYGAPADLAQAVMQRESGGNHYDRDGRVLTSGRGYRGLMGMHPVTAAGLGLGFNADDPEENVHAGLKYLGQNLEEFDGNKALALAGYHSGPHRAVAALSDPGDPRTKSYVKSILGADYGGYWHDDSIGQPSGPGRSVGGMQNTGSGETEPPVAGRANLRLPPNSFQQMLQRMLASKNQATLSDSSRAASAPGQLADDSTAGAPSSQGQASTTANKYGIIGSSSNSESAGAPIVVTDQDLDRESGPDDDLDSEPAVVQTPRRSVRAQRSRPPVYSWTDPYTKTLADRFEQVKASGTPTARTDAQEIARELQRRGYIVQGLGPDEWPAIQTVLPLGTSIADPETLNQKYLFEVNKALGNYDAAEQYGWLLQKKGWEYGYPAFGAPYVKPPANHPYAAQLAGYGIPSAGDVQSMRARAQANWERNASKLGLDPDDPLNIPNMPPATGSDFAEGVRSALDASSGGLLGRPLTDIVAGTTGAVGRLLKGVGNTINAAVPPQMLQSPWQQELGPEGLASIGKEYEGPSLGQPFRETGKAVGSAAVEMSKRGLDPGLPKDILQTIGATIPALVLRHPALIGLSPGLESMADNPDVQRAVIEGVKAGAAVGLMSGAANLIDETAMGALPKFAARAGANVAIPAVMGGRAPTLPDLAFGAGYALMHGGQHDEQTIRDRAARIQEVATHPELHPDVGQSFRDIADGKFDAPDTAFGPQGSGPEPLRTEALDPDSMLGQARALHTARLQERASKISDDVRYLRDVEGAGPDDPDVEELEHERLGIARAGEWTHQILNNLEHNPQWEKLPPVVKRAMLGLKLEDANPGSEEAGPPSSAAGPTEAAKAQTSLGKQAAEPAPRFGTPTQPAFEAVTQPTFGQEAQATEMVQDLRDIPSNDEDRLVNSQKYPSDQATGRIVKQGGAESDPASTAVKSAKRDQSSVLPLRRTALRDRPRIQAVLPRVPSQQAALSETRASASRAAIRENEIADFEDFRARSRVGDQLEGHELLQHAILKREGLATTRLSTQASRRNPVIALRRSIHGKATRAQSFIDTGTTTALENISQNARILRDIGISGRQVQKLTDRAIKHGRTLGLIE
jgi:hypothetical protein